MGLSFNPVDVWKIFAESKNKSKEQLADWLDMAAADARKIADVWIDKYNTMVHAPQSANAPPIPTKIRYLIARCTRTRRR